MANVNAPFGMRPTLRTYSGAPGRLVEAHKLVGYGTALFTNDAVTAVAAGIRPSTAISAAITPGTTPTFGVNLTYGAASTLTDHTVVLGAGGAVFCIQGDGTGSYLLISVLNKNANLALTAGNTGTKVSKHQLSETSLQTTNTLDLRILKLWNSPDNVAGQYARVEVRFNRDMQADQIAGI